jgi:endoglucanase
VFFSVVAVAVAVVAIVAVALGISTRRDEPTTKVNASGDAPATGPKGATSLSSAPSSQHATSPATDQPSGASPDCPALSAPAYQRVNPENGSTLITTDAIEARRAAAHGFTLDLGQPFNVSSHPGPGVVPIKELINGSTGDHLYTGDPEAAAHARHLGYARPRIVFYAPRELPDCDTTPIYRMTKAHTSQYTATDGERVILDQAGWRNATVAFSARLNESWSWPSTHGQGPLDQPLYLYTSSKAWRAYHESADAETRRLLYQIAATPTAIWLGGSPDTQSSVDLIEANAAAEHTTPVFVLYAIPHRDCGGYASGGLGDATAYRRWIDQVRLGINGRPAVVIVEPDALGMSCLGDAARADRIGMLRYAIQTLSDDPNTWVYVHAGSSQLNPAHVVPILIQIDVRNARGLAINVAGYGSTESEMRYGDRVVAALSRHGIDGVHYVIDTSRDGLGRAPDGSVDAAHGFCNQRGRALGPRPTPITGNPNADAFLWIKPPGESDGDCFQGDPKSGWYQSYAIDLVRRSLERRTISELPAPR